jgi:hypothetical protein
MAAASPYPQVAQPAPTAVAQPPSRRVRILSVYCLFGLAPVALSVALGPARFCAVAGLSFAMACAAATHLTQRRSALRPRRLRTLAAVAVGAVGQPLVSLLSVLALGLTGALPRQRSFAPLDAPGFLVTIGIGSAICALLAAASAAIWARAATMRMLVAMLVVGVCWPATLFLQAPIAETPLGPSLFPQAYLLVPFGPAMTFAWHVPMAMLTGWWVSARTGGWRGIR